MCTVDRTDRVKISTKIKVLQTRIQFSQAKFTTLHLVHVSSERKPQPPAYVSKLKNLFAFSAKQLNKRNARRAHMTPVLGKKNVKHCSAVFLKSPIPVEITKVN